LAVTVLMACVAALPADGHVDRNKSWYWYIGTRDLNNPDKQLDPIDILWAPGSTYSSMNESNVQNEVESQWRRRPSKGQMNHGQVCLGQGRIARIVGDGRQNVIFKSDNGSGELDRVRRRLG
jgi:hypothetical protein